MSKAFENRLDKLERVLGMVAADEGEDDPRYEWQTAEQNAAAHRAIVLLLMTHTPSPRRAASLADVRVRYVAGPRRVRKRPPAAQVWHDELMATCPFDLHSKAAEAWGRASFAWCEANPGRQLDDEADAEIETASGLSRPVLEVRQIQVAAGRPFDPAARRVPAR